MGADMCVAYIGFEGNMNIQERLKKIISRIKKASEKEINYYWIEKDEDTNMNLKEKKEHLISTAIEFFNCLNCRDVTSFIYKGDTIYLTGGLSWGDLPTESSGIFEDLVYIHSDILKAGGVV